MASPKNSLQYFLVDLKLYRHLQKRQKTYPNKHLNRNKKAGVLQGRNPAHNSLSIFNYTVQYKLQIQLQAQLRNQAQGKFVCLHA